MIVNQDLASVLKLLEILTLSFENYNGTWNSRHVSQIIADFCFKHLKKFSFGILSIDLNIPTKLIYWLLSPSKVCNDNVNFIFGCRQLDGNPLTKPSSLCGEDPPDITAARPEDTAHLVCHFLNV